MWSANATISPNAFTAARGLTDVGIIFAFDEIRTKANCVSGQVSPTKAGAQ